MKEIRNLWLGPNMLPSKLPLTHARNLYLSWFWCHMFTYTSLSCADEEMGAAKVPNAFLRVKSHKFFQKLCQNLWNYPHISQILHIRSEMKLLYRGSALWNQVLATEKFPTYPSTLLQVGIYTRRHTFTDTLYWKGTFEYEFTDSRPQTIKKLLHSIAQHFRLKDNEG